MHENTKAELIEAGGTAIMGMMKELFVRQREMDQLERQAQMEKEVELARAGIDADGDRRSSGSQQGRDGVVGTLNEARGLADEYESLLDQAEEMESCKLCKQLIRGARQRPAAQQDELLGSLSEFFQSIEDGTPTEEVAQRVRRNDELLALMQETVGAD